MSKSVEDLFRDAPEGATHVAVIGKFGPRVFYNVRCNGSFEFMNEGFNKWHAGIGNPVYALIERPKQPQAWSGPEDGLPPVGVTCERRFDDLEDSSWQQMTVIAYGKRKVFYSDKNGDEWGHYFSELQFRAIKTKEQQASDKRESAIRELMDIAQVDCRVTAARLVDAGFKR
jgi:hypothetical protein